MNYSIELTSKYRTALMDGTLVPDSEFHMATEDFYHAYKGDRIELLDSDYLYSVALFIPERDDHFIYTYDYQKEENWTKYTGNVTPDSYISAPFVFDGEYYFRVNVKRVDGQAITNTDEEKSNAILSFIKNSLCSNDSNTIFEKEIIDTIKKNSEFKGDSVLRLALLSDSHNVTNGTWNHTVANMSQVSDETPFDAIIHLGDLTDGMLSKQMTKKRVKSMLGDMKNICPETYVTLGNHDHNYFRNKAREYDDKEINEIYEFDNGPNYTVDVPDKNLTMVFIDSFDDNEAIRYGYSDQTLNWITTLLDSVEKGRKLLVFSHCPPLEELDYWSFYIRNGRKLINILDQANVSGKCEIIGLIYGHTHADTVFEGCSFPLIGIGCNKLEYFLEKKPKNAITPNRIANDVSEDLWDCLNIDFNKKSLNFIRFGAGEDRTVSFVSRTNTYEDTLRARSDKRQTKVWAHRGASGYTPENTIIAFKIAIDMGADGIETDVQLTKDGIPVIIHDERIDRVSNGTGRVTDYTLEELRSFNFNNHMDRFGNVKIPTLEEFLNLVKDKNITINLELKNGIINYVGLEQIVVDLVKKYKIEDRVIYSSFNHDSVINLKTIEPEAKIGLLYSHVLANPVEYAITNGADALHPGIGIFNFRNLVNRCKEKNIKIHTWTVNEPYEIEKMKEYGVDAIITNYIDRCI